jgi:hypothetical protein
VGSDQLFQKKKFRQAQALARHKAKRSPYETILIVCEDSKSARFYLEELKKEFRLNTANVIVVPSRGSAPISVAEHAIALAKVTPGVDRVACVFDRDEHESHDRAIDKLKNHKPKQNDKSKPKYQAITSTPCFEIWILLHFGYTTKPYSPSRNKSAAELVHDDVCKKLPSYTKKSVEWFSDLMPRLNSAIKHAKQLEEHNQNTKSTNPATNMHELVEYLRGNDKCKV